MIRVSGLTKSIATATHRVDILKGIDFDVPRGQFVAIMGQSGRAQQLLEQVGLLDRRDHYPVQLSGGEQQRIALARAFMVRPPILLADEPTGNLDSQNGQHILDLLISLNRQEGITLVLVTHDRMLADYADRRIVLRDGLVLSDELAPGPPV